jgi:DHA3 family macrolide efflux protein-like MFS transporter
MYIRVLKNKNIIFYLLGGGISRLGDIITGLAFLFLAYDLTESSLYTTGMVMAQVTPYLLFGLIGGVIADWVNKKSLLIWIDLFRSPIVFSLVLFYHFDLLTYWHLIVVSFMIQSLGSFFNPAHRAVLPIIINLEERTSVNSLLDTMTRGVQVLGPIISLGVLHSVGIIYFFAFDAMTYLLSAFMISKLSIIENYQTPSNTKKLSHVFLAIKEFSIWVKSEVTIRRLFIVTFITVFFNTWVWEVGLLLQLIEITENGREWYSSLLGWFGIIVILVNLVIPFMWKKLTLQTYLLGSLIWGIGILFLGFADHPSLFFLGILIIGMGLPLSGLSRVFLLQHFIPQDKLGRGFSFNAVLLYFSNLLSLGLFGILSSFVSVSLLFIVCGGMIVIVAIFYLIILFRKTLGVIPYKRLKS